LQQDWTYSKTSDSGSSEIETFQQRMLFKVPNNCFPCSSNTFWTSENRTSSLQIKGHNTWVYIFSQSILHLEVLLYRACQALIQWFVVLAFRHCYEDFIMLCSMMHWFVIWWHVQQFSPSLTIECHSGDQSKVNWWTIYKREKRVMCVFVGTT